MKKQKPQTPKIFYSFFYFCIEISQQEKKKNFQFCIEKLSYQIYQSNVTFFFF
jgi:hypothetical protein